MEAVCSFSIHEGEKRKRGVHSRCAGWEPRKRAGLQWWSRGSGRISDNTVDYFSNGTASCSHEKRPRRSHLILGSDDHLFYLAPLRTPLTLSGTYLITTNILIQLMHRKHRGEVIDHPSQGPDENHHRRFNTESPAHTFSPTSPPHPWWALYRTYLFEPLCDLASWKNAVSPDGA